MIKKIFKILLGITFTLFLILIVINLYMIFVTNSKIKKIDDIKEAKKVVLVLGAGIRNNEPSPLLKERLNTALKLYEKKKVEKELLSGDKSENYDELAVMKNYLIKHNVKEEDLIIDNFGYSTYESIMRAKKVYKEDNIYIVTQRYHLYRALYIASRIDLKAQGISANGILGGQIYRSIREMLARFKDLYYANLKVDIYNKER